MARLVNRFMLRQQESQQSASLISIPRIDIARWMHDTDTPR